MTEGMAGKSGGRSVSQSSLFGVSRWWGAAARYTPTRLDEMETATLTLSSPDAGEWVFLAKVGPSLPMTPPSALCVCLPSRCCYKATQNSHVVLLFGVTISGREGRGREGRRGGRERKETGEAQPPLLPDRAFNAAAMLLGDSLQQ